jgi:hypothetical protein
MDWFLQKVEENIRKDLKSTEPNATEEQIDVKTLEALESLAEQLATQAIWGT